MLMTWIVFVPSRGFLFFYHFKNNADVVRTVVFVPSRGFLFFYDSLGNRLLRTSEFSSPHGDFSFSIIFFIAIVAHNIVFVPSRGFLFFYINGGIRNDGRGHRFRPLTGISLFLCYYRYAE